MKKLLLSLAFATALAAPALAHDINVSVTATQDLTQIGVNNGAAQIQNIAGEDLKVDDDAFKNIETALDLGDLEIQNVEYIIGDHNDIAGVQNINDDVENASVLNADDLADVKIDVSFSEVNDSSNNSVDSSTNDSSTTYVVDPQQPL